MAVVSLSPSVNISFHLAAAPTIFDSIIFLASLTRSIGRNSGILWSGSTDKIFGIDSFVNKSFMALHFLRKDDTIVILVVVVVEWW